MVNQITAKKQSLLSKLRAWYTALSATVADWAVNQGDTYTLLASDFTGVGDDFHHYRVTTLPAHGTLYKSGVALALNGTFTEADLTAGLITYINDGLAGTDDSMAVKSCDSTTGVAASAAVTTITVTDGSWLLTLVSPGLPPTATRFSIKTVAVAQGSRITTTVGGVATVVFLPAAVVSGLPLNYFHGIDLLAASLPLLSARHSYEITQQAAKLLSILSRSENSDLSALVDTWGSALELEPAGRATMSESLKARWRNIRQEVEQVPATFAREFPIQGWWSVLDATAALIS